jgi:hypothetical protein
MDCLRFGNEMGPLTGAIVMNTANNSDAIEQTKESTVFA